MVKGAGGRSATKATALLSEPLAHIHHRQPTIQVLRPHTSRVIRLCRRFAQSPVVGDDGVLCRRRLSAAASPTQPSPRTRPPHLHRPATLSKLQYVPTYYTFGPRSQHSEPEALRPMQALSAAASPGCRSFAQSNVQRGRSIMRAPRAASVARVALPNGRSAGRRLHKLYAALVSIATSSVCTKKQGGTSRIR